MRKLATSIPRARVYGFSLIELLFVVLLTSVLVSMAVIQYHRASQRFAMQSEAISVAAQLERAKLLAQVKNTEVRLVFDEASRTIAPQIYNQAAGSWEAAVGISASPLQLSRRLEFGFPAGTNSPPYGPAATPISSATPGGSGPNAIQFNNRGFPVVPSAGLPDPGLMRAENALYLTDRKEYFAITVNILGQNRIWAYYPNAGAIKWVEIAH